MAKVLFNSSDWYEEKAPVVAAVDGVAKNGNPYCLLTIQRYRADGTSYDWRVTVFADGLADAIASSKEPVYFTGGMVNDRPIAKLWTE